MFLSFQKYSNFDLSPTIFSAHSLTAEIYPNTASNQTYIVFSSAPLNGAGIPHSKSRVIALCGIPLLIELRHDVRAFAGIILFSIINFSNSFSNFGRSKYQCFVFFIIGFCPHILHRGSINSIGVKSFPQSGESH
ncbi:hypothetical protein ES703_58385 [subsurface metagenome]